MTQLSDDQILLMRWALGNRKDLPKMTGDPVVNCEIDHRMDPKECPSWDNLDWEEKDIYYEEAWVFAARNKGKR